MTPGIYENQISVLYCSVPFLRSAQVVGCDGFKFTPADVQHLGGYQEKLAHIIFINVFSVSGEVGRCVDVGATWVVMVYSSILLVKPCAFSCSSDGSRI